MAAPFDLPDLATLRRWNEIEPYATDVPCRQVPAYARTGNTVSTSSTPIYTHWVDFEADLFVQDRSSLLFPRQVLTDGDLIQVEGNGRLLTLVVLWVEDRYTNTDNNYQRAYCTRFSRVELP